MLLAGPGNYDVLLSDTQSLNVRRPYSVAQNKVCLEGKDCHCPHLMLEGVSTTTIIIITIVTSIVAAIFVAISHIVIIIIIIKIIIIIILCAHWSV